LASKNDTAVNVLYKLMVNTAGVIFYCEKYGSKSPSKLRRMMWLLSSLLAIFIR